MSSLPALILFISLTSPTTGQGPWGDNSEIQSCTAKLGYQNLRSGGVSLMNECYKPAQDQWGGFTGFADSGNRTLGSNVRHSEHTRCCCFWSVIDCWQNLANRNCTTEEAQELKRHWDRRSDEDEGYQIPSSIGCDSTQPTCGEFRLNSFGCRMPIGWEWFKLWMLFVVVGVIALAVTLVLTSFIAVKRRRMAKAVK